MSRRRCKRCCQPPWTANISVSTGPTPYTCDVCQLASQNWRFSFSGISDGSGSNCSDYNGTVDITLGSPGFGCCSGNHNLGGNDEWSLAFCSYYPFDTSIFEYVELNGRGVTYRNYVFSACPFSDSSVILTKTTDTGVCSGWPSTVTIEAF